MTVTDGTKRLASEGQVSLEAFGGLSEGNGEGKVDVATFARDFGLEVVHPSLEFFPLVLSVAIRAMSCVFPLTRPFLLTAILRVFILSREFFIRST